MFVADDKKNHNIVCKKDVIKLVLFIKILKFSKYACERVLTAYIKEKRSIVLAAYCYNLFANPCYIKVCWITFMHFSILYNLLC